MTMPNLAVAIQNHNTKRDELLRQFPGLEHDEETLLDTLEGIDNLTDQIVAVVRSSEDDAAMVSAIKARQEELRGRSERLQARSEAKRIAALNAMLESGRRKLEMPEFTLSVASKPPSVIITDESLIPADYMRTPEPPAPKPDKKALTAALKDGASVPGCVLSNSGFTLQVRRS